MRLPLSRRITVAFTLLTAVVCCLFAAVVYLVFEGVEHTVFPGRMAEDLAWVAALREQGYDGPLPEGRRHWIAPDIPSAFSGFSPGFHTIEKGSQNDFVMVGDINGRRHVLAYDESDFERLEGWLWLSLVLGCAVAILAAAWLAALTANRIIHPVRELARAVREDRPPEALPLLQAEDEMGELARAFAARAEGLQQALARERLFTADASHELRTPLTVVLGAAEVLRMRAGELGDVDARQAAERVLRAAREASAVVGAFLVLSRAPDPSGAPLVALRPLVEREVERQRVWLADKPVALEFKVEAEPVVSGVPELLVIAIGNLVRNACQYTSAGAVTVTLKAACVEISDTGPGLPPVVRERLFQRQTPDETPAVQGNGLGLSIVHRVVEHLGWRVTHEAAPSGGSRFTLRFEAG